MFDCDHCFLHHILSLLSSQVDRSSEAKGSVRLAASGMLIENDLACEMQSKKLLKSNNKDIFNCWKNSRI